MQNTQLFRYIKSNINDDYAMDVLYYCIRRIVADNDYDFKGVNSIRISRKFHKEDIAINLYNLYKSRLDALSLVLSIRALMLNHNNLNYCNNDKLLFSPCIEHEYRWLKNYQIINECIRIDKDFACTFEIFCHTYEDNEISGVDDDRFESYTIMPERRNLRAYYEAKAYNGLGVTDEMICDNAFLCNDDIEEYKIGKKIEYVGNTAFSYCSRLKTIKIRNREVLFGKFPILECNALESIYVPEGTFDYYKKQLPYYKDIIREDIQGIPENSPIVVSEISQVAIESEQPVVVENITKEFSKPKRSMLKRLSRFVKKAIKKTISRKNITIQKKTDDERMALIRLTFEKEVTSYKYFWLLSLLYYIRRNGIEESISINSMTKEMVVQAWMYVMEYEGKFPVGDQLSKIVYDINRDNEPGDNIETIRTVVDNDVATYGEIRSMVKKLGNTIPYMFLTPWLTSSTPEDIAKRSLLFENDCPYSITKEIIKINPLWNDFFKNNIDYILEFVEDELCNYLNIEFQNDKEGEDDWKFVKGISYIKSSKTFLAMHPCRIIMAKEGYYLELDDEFIKLGEYPNDMDSLTGSIWIKRPLIGTTDYRIVHVDSLNRHYIGSIREENKIIIFTTPSGNKKTINFE